MPLLDALQVLTYSCYFKDIFTCKYEVSPTSMDYIKMTEECSAAIADGAPEKKRDPRMSNHPVFHRCTQVREGLV